MTQRQRCARCRGPVTGNGSVENNTDRFRSNTVNGSVHVTVLSTKEKLVFDCCYRSDKLIFQSGNLFWRNFWLLFSKGARGMENLPLDLFFLYSHLNFFICGNFLKKFWQFNIGVMNKYSRFLFFILSWFFFNYNRIKNWSTDRMIIGSFVSNFIIFNSFQLYVIFLCII